MRTRTLGAGVREKRKLLTEEARIKRLARQRRLPGKED